MFPTFKRAFKAVVVFLFFAAVFPNSSRAQLKTSIKNPQGGLITYGSVDGQRTEAGAMGAVLHSLHDQYGDRPQVGRLFDVRGTQSVACFFTVNKRKQGGGQLAGMLIVAKATTDHVEAAVVSDDVPRFGSTLNPMLKTLMSRWHPLEAGRTAGQSAPIPPMQKFITQDRSAAVDLPQDWKPDPQSGGGTLAASGPNGEAVFLGFATLASDTRNPHVQQTLRKLQQGGLRNTSYANAFYYPFGTDLAKAYVDTMQFNRHRRNLPAATFEVANEERVPSSPGQYCAHITGNLDPQDGKGKHEFNAVYCVAAPSQFGTYMTLAYFTTVPVAYADKERATLGAILASYQIDNSIVQREANALAAPAIAQIHAIGRAAADQARAAHEIQAIQNSSVYQRWDDNDKRAQGFSHYLLEETVVSDTDHTGHATLWNKDAQFLVEHFPKQFEYVDVPDYWKGIDY